MSAKRPEPYTRTLLDWLDTKRWLEGLGYSPKLLAKLDDNFERSLNYICGPEEYEVELRPLVTFLRTEFAEILTRYGYLEVELDW